MAITGAVGAFLRRNDPYPDWTFVHDYTGLGPNNPGRPVYKNNGVIYNRPDYDPNFSFTRSGADLIYFNPVENIWKAVEANKTGIDSSGFQIHEATTNKCTNYNAAPTDLTNVTKSGDAAATLTVVDDTVALIAAGFGDLVSSGKMNGKVYKLDNSAGSATAQVVTGGASGNTNSHTLSAVIRNTGTAVLRFQSQSGPNIATSSAYVRRTITQTPGSSAVQLVVEANVGSVVYFILNQLEEKTYATNPVIVSGAAATRGNAQPVITGLSSILTPPFTLVAVANLSAIDGANRYLAALSAGGSSNNRLTGGRFSSNNLAIASTSGGSATSLVNALNYTGPRLVKIAARVRTTESRGALDGALSATFSISPPVGMDRLDLGAGNGGAFSVLNSPLLFAGIAPDLTDAQLQYITQSSSMFTDFT